ncbi:Pantothenate transporter liz1 [Lachnellula suecica]|uniref:Pantothenate transporter liz1 n=1 Tax=Lachnellula suecica TaxID=602035 RepID=A0A8T9C3C4_9HELO|nr:Pantothenate transporter liz1 [Lachnellula suecica]
MTDITTLSHQGILRYPSHKDKSPRIEAAAAESESSIALEEDGEKSLKAWEKPGTVGAIRRAVRSIQRYIWDDPDKPKAEKFFLFKLDCFLLSYGCLVSGMKEALGMGGSQLTYMSNVFTAGYVISQLPAVILATKVRPSILIPTLEVLWSVFTFCSAAVKSVPQLYALRFLIGLCKGAFFPVIIYVIGSWYTKQERAKRVTLFYCTAALASMFSGYLQAAAYNNLSGKMGHSGWQWLFIICGTISLPVGVMGYFFNPDFPENTRDFYLTNVEVEFAQQGLLDQGYKALGASPWDRKKLFKIMSQWQFWVLPFGYFFVQASYPVQQPAYTLWLKSEKYSIYQINVWPTGQAAVGAVVQIIAGMLSDSKMLRGKRWQPILVTQAGTFFSAVVLAIWNVPRRLKFAAFYLSYFSAGVPGIWYAWYPDLIPHDHEMRGFLIATSNMCGYINSIWFSDAVWRTAEGPTFKPGWIAASSFGVAIVLLTLLVRFLELRDGKQREFVQSGAHDLEVPVSQDSEK